MKPLWAIQKFALHDDDGKGLKEAIESLGMRMEMLNLPPFDYEHVDPVDYDGPVIPYGGTKFIESIKDDDGWFCVFNEEFTYKNAMKYLGDMMFNGDGQCLKMKDFSPSMFKGEKYLFIRPDKDIKEFAGNVVKPEEFIRWYRQIEAKGWGVNEDTDIVVAPASRIDEEWRIFVVNDEIVDGSKYKGSHGLLIDPHVPESVYDYVREAIDIWQPAPFFVIDIVRVSDSLSIMELGDLHSAGFYATDKRKVIEAVSKYVEETYEEFRKN